MGDPPGPAWRIKSARLPAGGLAAKNIDFIEQEHEDMHAHPANRLTFRTFLSAMMMLALLGAPALTIGAEESEAKTIADHMSVINDNHKKLRRSARSKEFNDESITLASEMVKAAEASREMVPPMADKFKGEEREKFIAGYKKEMDAMIVELKGLEKALKEKRNDDAAKSIDKLNEIKKQGHDKYVEE
jgi:soluble cytochrome b562